MLVDVLLVGLVVGPAVGVMVVCVLALADRARRRGVRGVNRWL